MICDILIIDDEELVCTGLSRILREKGYSVDFALDGLYALQMMRKKKYDVVLLDINLPGKSGIDLLPEIKLISPDVLIIMITAFSDVYQRIKAIRAGAHDYFIKSIKHDELLKKINKALETQKLRKNSSA